MPEPELQTETTAQDQQAIRQSVRELCRDFPDAYWRKVDKAEEYPEEFVKAVTKSGYLAALIPEEYGGAGMGITEASIILEEINRCRRQSGSVPRADVHHGHASAPRQ